MEPGTRGPYNKLLPHTPYLYRKFQSKFMKGLLTCLLLHSAFVTSAQLDTYPTSKEIEMFMDTFLLSYTHRPGMVFRLEYNLDVFTKGTSKVCNFFTPAECEYIIQQVKRDHEREWKKRTLKQAGLEVTVKGNKVWQFSTPLFTRDMKYVVINIGWYCGPGCGQGCTYILRREKKKWVNEQKVGCWMK